MVYPLAKQVLSDGDQEIDQHLAEHMEVKKTLVGLDKSGTDKDQTDKLMADLQKEIDKRSLCDNDKANMEYSTKVITDILHAGGAQDVLTIQRYAHLIGGARMGTGPDNSVVDSDQRSWAVPTLFITDGSVCPTQGSANPALTIMALASRLAERIIHGHVDAP